MTAPLWTAAEAAAATGGTATADWSATGVSIDSRSVERGDLFVALKDSRDGHAFVADALGRGAAAVLVTHRPEGVPEDAPLLIVEDTLEGLRGLGAAARARTDCRVIGVTGSVGKTGTKEMLRAMLAPQGATHAPERSFNNHWGVPLTLARMPQDTRFAVIEMGMNHAGEITPLTRLARPDVAMITTVEAVHLENFVDETGIADAKAEIFWGLPESGGTAVLNRDNRHFAHLAEKARIHGARVVGFGSDHAAEARLVSVTPHPMATVAQAVIQGEPVMFRVSAPGRHLVLNALGALAAVQALGADLAHAAIGLGQWQAPEGRGARWIVALAEAERTETIEVIDEAYNANPASVAAALAVLAAHEVEDGVGRIARGRRIAVLGDMLELGPQEAQLHADLAALPELQALDLVLCVGERMRALDAALPPALRGGWFPDAPACVDRLAKLVDAGDVVMVKGSNGLRMGRIVEKLKALGQARTADRAAEDG
jgi:UDP-N-acetylmuramoyl-tripeptide--D-alanyl-D-alanine ligase